MESVRDIVVIVFGITGTITSVVLVVLGVKLYVTASQAMQRIEHVAEDIHGTAHDVRGGVSLVKGIVEIVSVFTPGVRLFKPIYKGAISLSRAANFVSRLKNTSKSKS